MNSSATLLAKHIKLYRKKNNLPVYDGGLGENPLPPPQSLVNTIKEKSHLKEYTNTDGIPELRNLFDGRLIVGNGLKPLIFLIQLAFSKLYSDGVIYHIIPAWVSYLEQTNILKLSTVRIMPDKNYKVTPDILESYFKDYKCPKLVLFNNPCNPSGCIYTKDELKELSKVFEKYDCIVFSDEIYKEIVHKKYEDNLGDISDYYKKVIRGSSLSKSVACGGYRFGWLVFPNHYLDELYKISKVLASSIYTCPSLMLQYVAVTSLNKPDDIKLQIEFQREMFQSICEFCLDEFRSMNLLVSDSKSAWYILIDFVNYSDKLLSRNIKNSDELSTDLSTSIGFITVSGSAFGIENNFVLRYSLVDIKDIDINKNKFNIDNIQNGIKELKKWLRLL